MPQADPTTINAWTSLLRAHTKALYIVEKALKSADLPPLAWYDVLWELEQSDNQGMRPYILQSKLLLAQYGMSRLLSRIEKAGYITRESCGNDGRGQLLFISPAGKKIRVRMWAIYGPAITQAIGDKINPSEAEKLSMLLGKLSG